MIGSGIIKGLEVTARNLIGSFRDGDRYTNVAYPEQKLELPENFRSFPFLVFDGSFEKGLRCVACKMCESECPPQCIYIEMERDEKGKPAKRPKVFDIDTSVCMGCGICAEVCPFESIKMDKVFEIATTSRFSALLLHKEELAKSNEYFHQIRPTEATEVDARLAEEQRVAAEKAAAKAAAAAAKQPAVPSTPAPKPSTP